MAQQHKPACGRCITPTPATVTRSFRIDNDNHKIDLCDKHNEMFDRDIVQWTLYGYEDPTYGPSTRMFSRESTERDRAAAAKRVAPTPMLAPVPDLAPAVSDTDRLRWALTSHAQERAAQRGVSVDEAIFAAAYPERVLPTTDTEKYGLGSEIRYADDVGVVVDPHRRIVITVYPRRADAAVGGYAARRVAGQG